MIDQATVQEFLGDPATHGMKRAVERIETHVSVVFLAGKLVYKMKRAVRFPFLDFRTLDLRANACRREIEINRRTAPSIYRRVVPVTDEGAGRLAIDGTGTPVEWLVEMNRFDEETLFDRLAGVDRGLRRRTMEGLADEIARFHAAAKVRKDKGGGAGLRAITENNLRSFRALPAGFFDAAKVDAVMETTFDALDAVGSLLDERLAAGRVRECHGDLHLRNICLVDGAPTLFDAIEFSEDFSVIDTLYDLSFLLMDLGFRKHGRLASFVFNRYLDVGDETADAYRLLPVMQSMRAQIRAHVGAAAARAKGETARGGEELDRARLYLDYAAELFDEPPLRLIAVGGLSGSGKSRLARELATFAGAAPGARVVRTDALRKRIAGVPLEQRLGPDGYTSDMTERTYSAFYGEAAEVLSIGQTVIMDAVFALPEQRRRAEEIAAEAGVPFVGIWVDAPLDVRVSRVEERTNNVSDADAAVAKRQQDYDVGSIDWVRVDSSGSKERTLQTAYSLLFP